MVEHTHTSMTPNWRGRSAHEAAHRCGHTNGHGDRGDGASFFALGGALFSAFWKSLVFVDQVIVFMKSAKSSDSDKPQPTASGSRDSSDFSQRRLTFRMEWRREW